MAVQGLCNIFEKFHESNLDHLKYRDIWDGFKISEISIQNRNYHIDAKAVRDVDVIRWLTRNLGIESSNPSEVLASIRIVWIELNDKNLPWTFNITSSNKNLILDHFDVKQAYAHSFTTDRGLACLPMLHDLQPPKISFSFSSYRSLRLSWTYDFSTSSTSAVCVGYGIEHQSGRKNKCDQMKVMLENLKTLAWHPMFLAIAASALTLTTIEETADAMREEVVRVEMRTGHGKWGDTVWISAAGGYDKLSAQMSGTASSLASCECDRIFLDDCLDQLHAYDLPKRHLEEDRYIAMKDEFCACIQMLRQRSKQAESHIRNASRRADIQLTALFNLISQQDTQVSISVARDSRILALASQQDSTAMKVLALVTVFFLPMTFIAALFSMPLFHWRQTTVGESAMAEQFWMYWAVSVPLTLLTLAAYAMIYRQQSQSQLKTKEDGMNALHNMLYGLKARNVESAFKNEFVSQKKEV